MAGTVAVAVKKAIRDGLRTALATPFPTVEVSYGWDPNSHSAERVFFTDARFDHDPASLKTGRNFRAEDATLELRVVAMVIGGAHDEAEQRAADIGRVVEEFVADRKSNELGVTGLQWLRMTSGGTLRGGVTDRGSVGELTYRIAYHARLT